MKKILRIGIVLLGIRLSIGDVARLGAVGLPIVVCCIVSALIVTTLFAKWMSLSPRLGTLIAVGTSICGVSAILATAPAIRAEKEEVSFAVAVISTFGLIATLLYPPLSHLLFAGDPTRAGLFLGTAIHDTSQVTGAGLVYSQLYSAPGALDVATVTKLVRNLFMSAVIPLLAIVYNRRSSDPDKSAPRRSRIRLRNVVPLFVLGFVLLAVVRSVGDATLGSNGAAYGVLKPDTWNSLISILKNTVEYCMVVALAAVGLSTRMSAIKTLGIKPFFVGLAAAASVGIVSYGLVVLLGPLVRIS